MNLYDDSGNVTLTCGFNWDAIDAYNFTKEDELKTEAIEIACEGYRKVWTWIYQPPCDNLDGWTCRCIIATWLFVPQLRSYTLTEIAGRFGKKKQSLDRWVQQLKQEFPELATLEHFKKQLNNNE